MLKIFRAAALPSLIGSVIDAPDRTPLHRREYGPRHHGPRPAFTNPNSPYSPLRNLTTSFNSVISSMQALSSGLCPDSSWTSYTPAAYFVPGWPH